MIAHMTPEMIGLMAKILAGAGGIAFLCWVWHECNKKDPPRNSGSSGMTDGDYYFMNEWCDGD